MQTNILWTGREYYSLENCLVETWSDATRVTSTIIGSYQDVIYKVDYRVETNEKFETTLVKINGQYDNLLQAVELHRERNGRWYLNGLESEQFNGCTDIDIALTPFTNTPIRRLRFAVGSKQEIKVIYVPFAVVFVGYRE